MNCKGGCVLLLCVGAFGVATAGTPPNPNDLTQGAWELDIAKSRFCDQAEVPRSSHREIVDVGWGLVSVYWTGLDSAGKPVDIRYVYRYDGQKYPDDIKTLAGEAISWKLVSPNRVEFLHWSRGNKVTQRLVRAVSDDGRTMTQTTRLANRPGCTDVQVFTRQ
jgi:hypothetical protein